MQGNCFDLWVGKIPQRKWMATHSSIVAWRISWAEEPGGLQCHKESGTTKWLSYTHIDTHTYTYEKVYKLKLKATSNLKTREIVKLTSKGEYTDGLTYAFSTLWWCKSNMHLVEVRLWILIFSWASNTQHDTPLWCWAVAVFQRSQSAT